MVTRREGRHPTAEQLQNTDHIGFVMKTSRVILRHQCTAAAATCGGTIPDRGPNGDATGVAKRDKVAGTEVVNLR